MEFLTVRLEAVQDNLVPARMVHCSDHSVGAYTLLQLTLPHAPIGHEATLVDPEAALGHLRDMHTVQAAVNVDGSHCGEIVLLEEVIQLASHNVQAA